ncbi:MAG: Sfum_1244 family protein [bacterium]
MPNVLSPAIQTIQDTCQQNCHIADARYAGDYTLCVYLLKMREFYRWEQQLNFARVLTNDDVGDWLIEREGLWDELEQQTYQTLTWQDRDYHPLDDHATLNQALNKVDLVYSAGYGQRCRAHFFLAELKRVEQREVNGVAFTIYYAGKELARDIAAPPAMSQGRQIFIREESLRRMLWEKVEEWRWQPIDNALGRAIQHYTFDKDDTIDHALTDMLHNEIPFIVAHEVGEVLAEDYLGESWNKLLNTLPRSTAEIMLRAVRDHLADCLSTIPQLLADNKAQQPTPALHFYIGHLSAMQKKLAPALITAYDKVCQTQSLEALQALLPHATQHWQTVANHALRLFAEQGDAAALPIEAYLDAHLLEDHHL